MTRDLDRGNGLNGSIAERALGHMPNVVLPSEPRPGLSLSPPKRNTKELPWRITSDVTAAACASGLVSPLITIIDRYNVRSTSLHLLADVQLVQS